MIPSLPTELSSNDNDPVRIDKKKGTNRWMRCDGRKGDNHFSSCCLGRIVRGVPGCCGLCLSCSGGCGGCHRPASASPDDLCVEIYEIGSTEPETETNRNRKNSVVAGVWTTKNNSTSLSTDLADHSNSQVEVRFVCFSSYLTLSCLSVFGPCDLQSVAFESLFPWS